MSFWIPFRNAVSRSVLVTLRLPHSRMIIKKTFIFNFICRSPIVCCEVWQNLLEAFLNENVSFSHVSLIRMKNFKFAICLKFRCFTKLIVGGWNQIYYHSNVTKLLLGNKDTMVIKIRLVYFCRKTSKKFGVTQHGLKETGKVFSIVQNDPFLEAWRVTVELTLQLRDKSMPKTSQQCFRY